MDMSKLNMIFDGENFTMYYGNEKIEVKFSPILLSQFWRSSKSFDKFNEILLRDCEQNIRSTT